MVLFTLSFSSTSGESWSVSNNKLASFPLGYLIGSARPAPACGGKPSAIPSTKETSTNSVLRFYRWNPNTLRVVAVIDSAVCTFTRIKFQGMLT